MEKPSNLLLHTRVAMRRTWFNRIFAVIYLFAILALFFRHFVIINNSGNYYYYYHVLMLVADAVLAFMWATRQAFRMTPIRRSVFPENLPKLIAESKEEYPALDIFVCTADPYKEPPMGVVNTALSLMAFDYPPEKLSVYVSDDGGSQFTLFAFVEAAAFAKHWLQFCRTNNLTDRSPHAYFTSDRLDFPAGGDEIKVMYESMKMRVEDVVERGSIDRYVADDEQLLKCFSKWTTAADGFTKHHHPTIIQVLLESGRERDVSGHHVPNLVYISREKNKSTPHHYKAGALNVLLRVSAIMSNAPIVLMQDCDMFSNDPETPLRALCYFKDPSMDRRLALVQFPQVFHGIDKDDIYCGQLREVFTCNNFGMDGLMGPPYMGSGAFFRRRAFFGAPNSFISPGVPEISPDHVVSKPIRSEEVMALAHHVAACNYESHTEWGSEMGIRYGSLVEDYNTGYRLQCQGWRSVYCNPKRAAFLGSSPSTLYDVLNQTKRWSMGLLDVLFSKYNPLLFGLKSMDIPLQALCFGHYACWAIWSIPMIFYSFLPQFALIYSFPIFPKVSDPWILLYVFLVVGAYGQDTFEFVSSGGTVKEYWNNQRIWMIRSLTSFPVSIMEYILEYFGMSTFGFNVTSKVVGDELDKRKAKGMFEFGISSPLFVPISVAAVINLVALLQGIVKLIMSSNGVISRFDEMFIQMVLAGFGVINCWPIYEAMVLRMDKGKMPLKITFISVFLVWLLNLAFSMVF